MTSNMALQHRRTGMRAAFLAGIVALAGTAPPTSAADAEYGVGVIQSGAGGNQNVLIPIRTEAMIVEPEIRISKSSSDGAFAGSDRAVELASGIYLRKQLSSSFEGYFGARVGYSTGKSTFGSGETRDSNWSVRPTAGIQYFFVKQFSVGFDVGLRYTRFTQKFTDSANPANNFTTHTSEVDTSTRVMLRAYF